MIKALSSADALETKIQALIITLGAVTEYLPFTSASAISWRYLDITDPHLILVILKKTKKIIDNKGIVSAIAYRTTSILVSDCILTDSWERELLAFVAEGRSAKCDRMAMAIGDDAEEKMLGTFIAGINDGLFYGDNASQIHDFFKFVTMSVTTRTKSQNPDIIPEARELYEYL